MNRRGFLKWAAFSAAALGFWAASPWLHRPKAPRHENVTACPPIMERSLTLTAVGDIMMHTPVSKSALQDDGSYDFRPHFQYVRPIFQNADVVVGNLETPLAGGPLKGYPSFNGPDDLLKGLKWAGVSALTLANNHSLDQGWKGLQRTAELAGEAGFIYFGAYRGAEDRATPRLFSAGGVTLGFSGYTYGVNGPWKYPADETWRLNFVEEKIMKEDIEVLKAAGADFIILNIHFGDEYQRKPNQRGRALVETLFEAGADLIIGHHPHVVQPGLIKPAQSGEARAAVFSLGNFISNQRDRYTDQGLMLTAKLGLDFKGQKYLGPVLLRQTRCIRRYVNDRLTYRVLPVYEAVNQPAAYGLTAEQAAFLAGDQLAMSRHLVDF